MNTYIKEIGGVKLKLRQDTSDEKCAIKNLVEHEWELFFPIEKGEYWLDLGAYIGTFALRVCQCKGIVTCFEPDPDNFACLEENLKLNQVAKWVERYQLAILMDYQPIAELIRVENKGNFWSNTLFNRWKTPKTTMKVPCIGFEGAVSLFQTTVPETVPMCLKMDIEGAEWDILDHSPELSIFDKICVELHWYQETSLNRLRAIKSKLESLGFTVNVDPKIPNGDLWRNPKRKVSSLHAIKQK